MSDPLLSELTSIAARFPRYSRAYGTCPLCGLGATILQAIQPVWWAMCQPCATRWPSAVQGLSTALDPSDRPDVDDVEPEIDDAIRAEFMYAAMQDLARCHELSPLTTTEGVQMKPTTTKTEPGARCVLWSAALAAGMKGNNDYRDPVAPPSSWAALSPPTCECLTVVSLEADPPGILAGPWRRLRARFMDADDMSESPSVAAALKGYYEPDLEERLKWRRAAEEIAAPGIGVEILELVSRKLRAGGGLLAVLRQQRAALDARIAQIERSTAVGV